MRNNQVHIARWSNGFYISTDNEIVKRALGEYILSRLTFYKWEKKPPTWKPRKVIDRVYAGRFDDKSAYFFSSGVYNDILALLKTRIPDHSLLRITNVETKDGDDVEFVRLPGYEDRDYQAPLIEFLAAPQDEPNAHETNDLNRRITDLQTGRGKTYSTVRALEIIGKRAFIQVKASYIKTWIDSLYGEKRSHDLKKEDIYVIKGTDSLLKLINEATYCRDHDEPLPWKVIVASSTTISLFIKSYEREGEALYGLSPMDLYDLLGIGVKVYDEAHKEYHALYRSDIYTHVRRTIILSATLKANDDPHKQQLYEHTYPKRRFFKGIQYDRYIKHIPLFYHNATSVKSEPKVKERGQDMYSHNAYEQWICHEKQRLCDYLDIINDWLLEFYLNDQYITGERCLIFCHRVETCDIVVDYLASKYPQCKVGAYHGSTDNWALDEADIIVSTYGSCGEAIDIVGLSCALNTRPMLKEDAQLQTMGRLRKNKLAPDKEPVYTIMYNTSVSKHMEYSRKVAQMLSPYVVGIFPLYADRQITK